MGRQLFAPALLDAIVEGGGALLEVDLPQPELRVDRQGFFHAYAVAFRAGSDERGEFGEGLRLGRGGGGQSLVVQVCGVTASDRRARMAGLPLGSSTMYVRSPCVSWRQETS
ncbi:hypothetical protein GCM10023238_05950 [Streptomyces heliomycini]